MPRLRLNFGYRRLPHRRVPLRDRFRQSFQVVFSELELRHDLPLLEYHQLGFEDYVLDPDPHFDPEA